MPKHVGETHVMFVLIKNLLLVGIINDVLWSFIVIIQTRGRLGCTGHLVRETSFHTYSRTVKA